MDLGRGVVSRISLVEPAANVPCLVLEGADTVGGSPKGDECLVEPAANVPCLFLEGADTVGGSPKGDE